ncbi:MAG: signal peptide peptidase SppA, partial [Nitrospinaceae bacterium]|nr:signal peptide peptidase SppA [Nitrospinaceae bacterium]NIR57157.1 signal peptide peptidase SppA [Nitrospinaceae bacterium]NIS87599.1 signal peptide peptidase SppA [Nitrospinaceae bacterium]NIT84470.1 signal peptide peptidase SppA [Nitrospinaceae bacterium]NIU46656.1 signal peptide peptidase SppA [Nitrospinaceae bacterium]
MENVGKPKRTFGRTLFYFLLAVIGLMVVSSLAGRFLGGEWDDTREKIAMVEINGMITDSRDIVRQISSYRRDDEIKAIILRIDSPGGAVAPSQEIYDEVLRVRESKKKIFASMGSLAASGGYYIAVAADRVFANPGTLTGSIGVIMAFSNAEELMHKIGLKPEVVKSGAFKDTGSPARKMRPEERKYLQKVVADVHEQFVAAVAKGRNMSTPQARKLADGRIFTGRQALKLDMVDELGGLEDAIKKLSETVGIKGRPKVIWEQPPK